MKKVCVIVLFVSVFSSKAMEDKELSKIIRKESQILCRMDDERDKALSLQNKIAALCQKNGDVEKYGELTVENSSDLKSKWIEFLCEGKGLQVWVSVLKNKNSGEVYATASCVRVSALIGYCTCRISLEASPLLVRLLGKKRTSNKSGHTVTFNIIEN